MNVFVLTTILAPYRIEYFNELGKYCKLTVCFESKAEPGRDEKWYSNRVQNFTAFFLANWDRSDWRVRTDIINYMKNMDYDIAIAFEYSTPTALLFMLWNFIKQKPYCINIDGGFISSGLLKTAIKRFFIKRAVACLASGEMATKYVLHYSEGKTRIFIHNFTSLHKMDILNQPISAASKSKLKSELGLPLKRTAIAVGRFIHQKGIDILIRAWKKVNSDYQLLIVGGGEKESEYKKLIQELNLSNVTLIGFKTKEELAKYYKACDLFVLPTREDIWGLVVNEAMAYGLPIISTDRCVAGIELIKNNENGFIVPIERPGVLAERIETVLGNVPMACRMGKSSLRKIRPYTIENMAIQQYQSLRKIMNE